MDTTFCEASECPVGILVDLSDNSPANETGCHRREQWTGGAVDQVEPDRSGQAGANQNEGASDKMIKVLEEHTKLQAWLIKKLKEEIREKEEALEQSEEEVKSLNKKLTGKGIMDLKPKVKQVVPPDPSLEDTVLVSPNDQPEAEQLGQRRPFTVLANVDASVCTRLEQDTATGPELVVHTLEENLEKATTFNERSDEILGQLAQFLGNELGEEVTKDQVLEKVKVLTMRAKEEAFRTVKMALELESSTAMTLS